MSYFPATLYPQFQDPIVYIVGEMSIAIALGGKVFLIHFMAHIDILTQAIVWHSWHCMSFAVNIKFRQIEIYVLVSVGIIHLPIELVNLREHLYTLYLLNYHLSHHTQAVQCSQQSEWGCLFFPTCLTKSGIEGAETSSNEFHLAQCTQLALIECALHPYNNCVIHTFPLVLIPYYIALKR